jgi:hypothetical protein
MKNLFNRQLRKREIFMYFFFCFVIYAGIYCSLSFQGRYVHNFLVPVPGDDGWVPPKYEIWEPKNVVNTPFTWNKAGVWFYPLLWLDRKVWHPNREFRFEE